MNLSLPLFLICLIGYVWGKTEVIESAVERPLRIGAFNIQKLGNSKFGNKKAMNVIKKVLLRYDLVLVQEIVTTDEELMENLVAELNKKQSKGKRFAMTISERLGRGSAKEQYAYLYRYDKLRFIHGHTFPDKYDEFMRPPYIAHFSTPTLRDISSIVAIGSHTQPKNAANETSALAHVYDYAAKYYNQKNAILMGDMNAGCSNVRIGDWEHIELWNREEFTWLIGHDVDTTVSTNCCPYDRIVVAGEEMNSAVIWDSILVFNYGQEYGLTEKETLEISDHWPVEVLLRAKVSDVVSNHLIARTCVVVEDNRKAVLPPEVQKQKTLMGFTIERVDGYFTNMYNIASDYDSLLTSFEKLQGKYPNFISKELLATVSYKVENGVLNDDSSHDELVDDVTYYILIELDEHEETPSVHFCTNTTPN